MNTRFFLTRKHSGTRLAAGLTAALAVAALAGRAPADPPYSMAPPIQSSIDQNGDAVSGSASQDSVFNWAEVPQNQQVPIRRAVFDQGGYQLYDTAGETIVIPFASQNLYVMKFGLSDNGSTYFVNTGDVPILYLPRGGSLENISVPGARWYPFPDDFSPAQPVFLGIAPSYPEFIHMGWYPDMYAYGGYYGRHSFLEGGIFLPTIGLEFVIGGRSYGGWEPYHRYYDYHPAPYRVTVINNNVYRGSSRHDDVFRGLGYRGADANRGFDGGHGFGGDRGFSGQHSYGNGHTFGSNGPQFSGGTHQSWAHRTFSGAHNYSSIGTSHSDAGRSSGGEHVFQGGQGGGRVENRRLGGGNSSFGGMSRSDSSQSRPAFTGGDQRASFGGSQRQPSFSGGEGSRPAFSGGDRGSRPTFNGGDRQRSSSSDNGRHGSSGGGNRSSRDSGGHDSRR